MAIYELKPPVVEAIQWTGDNVGEILAFGVSGIMFIQTGRKSWMQLSLGDIRRNLVEGDYIVYKARDEVPVEIIDEHTFNTMYKLRES